MPKPKTVKDDTAFEIAFYEKVLGHSPDFIEALAVLGELYTRAGEHLKGLVVDQRLARLRPDDPVVQYNLACSYSLSGDVPAAFEAIRRAVDCGYLDLLHLEQDRDLLNLMNDPGFQEYYRSIRTAGNAGK